MLVSIQPGATALMRMHPGWIDTSMNDTLPEDERANATKAAISCGYANRPIQILLISFALSSSGSVSFMLVSIQPGATALMRMPAGA